MARGPTPLVITATAALLLVVVVAVDVTITRSYELQVQEEGEWRTIATTLPDGRDRYVRQGITADANDTLEFRLVAHNEWPAGLSTSYDVRHFGTIIHEGTLTAPARGTGVAEFELDVSQVTEPQGPEPVKVRLGSIEVVVDGNYLWADVQLQEADA